MALFSCKMNLGSPKYLILIDLNIIGVGRVIA